MSGVILATMKFSGVSERANIVNDSMMADINTIMKASTTLHLTITMTMIVNNAILNIAPVISRPVAGIIKPRNAENKAKISKVPPSALYLIPEIVR